MVSSLLQHYIAPTEKIYFKPNLNFANFTHLSISWRAETTLQAQVSVRMRQGKHAFMFQHQTTKQAQWFQLQNHTKKRQGFIPKILDFNMKSTTGIPANSKLAN